MKLRGNRVLSYVFLLFVIIRILDLSPPVAQAAQALPLPAPPWIPAVHRAQADRPALAGQADRPSRAGQADPSLLGALGSAGLAPAGLAGRFPGNSTGTTQQFAQSVTF